MSSLRHLKTPVHSFPSLFHLSKWQLLILLVVRDKNLGYILDSSFLDNTSTTNSSANSVIHFFRSGSYNLNLMIQATIISLLHHYKRFLIGLFKFIPDSLFRIFQWSSYTANKFLKNGRFRKSWFCTISWNNGAKQWLAVDAETIWWKIDGKLYNGWSSLTVPEPADHS